MSIHNSKMRSEGSDLVPSSRRRAFPDFLPTMVEDSVNEADGNIKHKILFYTCCFRAELV